MAISPGAPHRHAPAFPARLEIVALPGLPLVGPGDDLAVLACEAVNRDGLSLANGDILSFAQKVVSKAEGRLVELTEVRPSPRAEELALVAGKDPRVVELILRESREVLRCVPGVIIVETHTGLVLANAGIDRSNVEQGSSGERVLLLPADPDASCVTLRGRIRELAGADVGVVINDSVGRAWRNGTIGTALGSSGVPALQDLRGTPDLFGYTLSSSEVATADEIAAASSLVMGQSDEGRPLVLIRGFPYPRPDAPARPLIRGRERDLFR